MEKVKDWLRLFRAQTAPATILLILTPYLTAKSLYTLETLALGLFALLAHWFSFGHNSLMDTALGYDVKDPNKKHHPLVAGEISLHIAHNVIHWGLSLLAVSALLLTVHLSPNPTFGVAAILLWLVFGYSYNSGLSKESILGFLPISICFTAMGAWGWLLSHSDINMLGRVYLAYTFMTILFQISWSGHLKELEIGERSNILIKMGARIKGDYFAPGKAAIYAWLIKGLNLLFGLQLLWLNFTLDRLVWFVLLAAAIITMLHQLTAPRIYVRNRELLKMSLMEIATIYLPIPIMLGWMESAILMLFGIAYFFGINRFIWGASHPRV